MRILSVYPELNDARGGPPRAVIDLADGFARAGHDVTVITLRSPSGPTTWERGARGSPTLIDLDQPRLPGDPLSTRHASAELREMLTANDVVLLRGAWSLMNVQVSSWARQAGVPYVVSTDGMLDEWSMAQSRVRKRLFLRLFGTRMLAGASAVHCTADAERDQARAWIPERTPIVVTPNLLDIDDLLRSPSPDGEQDGVPTVLFLSRLHPAKRPELVIEAFARWRGNAQLVMAGDGERSYTRGLKELARRHGLVEHVRFVGFVSGRTKVALYTRSQVLVVPSQHENFGNVFFEALAAGTHVMTTRGVKTWREIATSGNATIVRSDPDAIANEMDAVLGRPPEEIHRSAGNGRRWVERFLDRRRIIGEWEALLAKIRSPGRAHRPRRVSD